VATNAVVATTSTIPSANTTNNNTQSSTKPISSLGKHKLSSSNKVVPTPKIKPTTLSNNDDAMNEIKLPEEGADYTSISSYWKKRKRRIRSWCPRLEVVLKAIRGAPISYYRLWRE